MKKITIALAAMGCIAAAVLTSCRSDPDSPRFTIVETHETFPAPTGNFELDYRFEYMTWCPDGDVLKKIQAAMVSDFFGVEFVRADPYESARAFDQMVADIHGRRSEGEEEFRWDGYMKMRSYTDVLHDRVVAYIIERSDYTGGAHGMETVTYINYDLRTGDRLTLDDVFTPEGVAALPEAIRTRILETNGKGTWEELMTDNCYSEADEILPNDNFRLTATHITFMYNPYDIACYANGSTKVTLSLHNLAGFKKETLEK